MLHGKITHSSSVSTALNSLSKEDLDAFLKEHGQSSYRTSQILDWIWKKRVSSIDEMSNLSVELRNLLKENFELKPLVVSKTSGSKDTTFKYLFRLEDGRYVESVLIPANPALYGEKSDRRTLCVSSQVGCAYACKFCASGLAGFTRNLTADEIVGQIVAAERESGETINNVVFMGMGEPLANLKNLMKAIEIITAHWGLEIGARRLTVSTSGLAPSIKQLAEFHVPIRLAISLHGACDEVRDLIMPVNKKWNVDTLFDSLRHWIKHSKRKLTLEYILIKGINDDLDQAHLLAKRARSIKAKINLIPYNTVEGLEWERPSESHCRAFQAIVKKYDVTATLRLEKGHDINAACGQLRLKQETEEGIITAPLKELKR